MGELLIKPYEISVWEDKLTQNGFEETKLAVIGSDTMSGPNKVYDPVFTKNTNGEKTLTFSLKYKYFDPYIGNAEVVNPFAALLSNERKVKLKYGKDEEGKDQWYEFIVKDHTESNEEYTWTYNCTDAFVLELSKNGYNIEFSADLDNNHGTARELAKKTLEDTDWKLGGVDLLKQLVEEPIYKATLVSKTGIEIINASEDGKAIPDAGAQVYVFYSYVKNQNGKFVQFIVRDNSAYTIDSKNVITATNYRITTDLIFRDNGFYLGNAETPILSLGEIETQFHANRLAYGQLTTYDPIMGHTVDRYRINDTNGREVYKYTDFTYTTSTIVMNYVANGDNFNALEDGSLQGWNPYVDVEDGDNVRKLELVTRPELGTNKKLADVSLLSQIEGFLKATFNDVKKVNGNKTYNLICNSGIEDNASYVQSIAAGDQFVFRWRAGVGELDNLTSYKGLRVLVAKYEQDTPTRYGYYYKHVDPDDVIIEFDFSNIANINPDYNYITGGTLADVVDEETQQPTGKKNYVIDDVPQTPSTKYVYKVGNVSYVWDGELSNFYVLNEQTSTYVDEDEQTHIYLPYYYVLGTAVKSLSQKEINDPEDKKKIGIFFYIDEQLTEPVEITRILRREIPVEPEPVEPEPVEPTEPTDEDEDEEEETPTIQIIHQITETIEPVHGTSISFSCGNFSYNWTSGVEDSEDDIVIERDTYEFTYNSSKGLITFSDSSEEGIMSYTVSYTKLSSIYIQDVQLTRYIPDVGTEPVKPILVGNVPTATSNPTDYYYLKPDDGMEADDIITYTQPSELIADLGIQGGSLVPLYNSSSEKNLSISVSQSNCFNILQTIAETFECWIDLVVEHDAAGKILIDENGGPRKYVYLKEYVGKDNYAGFKYGVNLQSIERNINSDEIVTKLIVELAQSDYTDEGFVSIANAPSNISGEQYILNFDYYYSQGLLDRDVTQPEIDRLVSNVKDFNLELKELEKERRELNSVFTDITSKRNVYTELIDSAAADKNEALADFEELTGQTYDEYRELHNELVEPVEGETEQEKYERESEQLTEEENILEYFSRIYTDSAVINNYSGILTNINKQYWDIKHKLDGYENYKVKIWVDFDELEQRHVFISFNDYINEIVFTVGGVEYRTSLSQKDFDILNVGDGSTIEFNSLPEGFTINAENNQYEINDYKVAKFKIINPNTTINGISDRIEEKIEEKNQLVKEFNNRYRRYIQEGTWNSTDYIDSELYYLDALQVSNTSAQPVVTYTINVVEISQLEGFDGYLFDAGDKSYVEDVEFFGWADVHGIRTPAREEVIVSAVEWHLDAPDQNIITVQNYKTRFEDLFQRISAAVQTVQYNEATYAKISTLLDANGMINQNVLQASLNRMAGQKYNLVSDGSIWIDGDNILIRNLTNTGNYVKINSEGIQISSDGGNSWSTAINGQGINIGTVYTGQLNTNNVIIGNSNSPSFRWDKAGISAYKSTGVTSELDGETYEIYDLQTFVRYDQNGLYGIKEGGSYKPYTLEEIKDKAHFAITWDGFFIKNSYEDGGRVSITSDNDFQVIDGSDQERIKIGSLGVENNERIYGISIKDKNGNTVLSTNNAGDLTMTGTINATGGNFSGIVNVGPDNSDHIIIDGNNALIRSSNFQESAGYGWMINKDGDAVFNNITARGAIKTAVFEYAEIQAVGGIFIFRPSSTIKNAVIDGENLIFTVEKPHLFQVGSWCKVSNYTTDGSEPNVQSILSFNGLTHTYKVIAANGKVVTLEGAAKMVQGNTAITDLVSLEGGALIDMGREDGTSNYGIGVNSSDNTVNLPPRAISLFETIVDETRNPKVSYSFRGILGTLPSTQIANISVKSNIYNNMVGTQGIYTDNMYIGDNQQYLAFYTDGSGNKHLKISAREMVFSYDPETDTETTWEEHIDEQIPIRVEIESSAGELFVREDIRTTLTCYVYKGNEEITNQVIRFTWSKYIINSNGGKEKDETWVRLPGGRQITIGPEDVASKAIFECEVEL